MRKTHLIIFILICMCAVQSVIAETGKITYIEGNVLVRDDKGKTHDAAIDDVLDKGYTVTTGKTGYAEIDKSGSMITLSANTVFQFLEDDNKGKQRDVFSTVTGAVYMKIARLTSKDEGSFAITSPSTTLGVRGTAFNIYAGVDGSTLVAVEEGKVEVEAKGATVELGANEGVEVKPAAAPGAKFTALKGKVDFKEWSTKNLDAFLKDPVAATKKVEERIANYAENYKSTKTVYDKEYETLTSLRDKLKSIEEKAKRQEYYDATVFPQEMVCTGLYRNMRYYTLSALSLRRFVLGRMYLNVKSAFIMKLSDPLFIDFVKEYNNVLSLFDKEILPNLVDADF